MSAEEDAMMAVSDGEGARPGKEEVAAGSSEAAAAEAPADAEAAEEGDDEEKDRKKKKKKKKSEREAKKSRRKREKEEEEPEEGEGAEGANGKGGSSSPKEGSTEKERSSSRRERSGSRDRTRRRSRSPGWRRNGGGGGGGSSRRCSSPTPPRQKEERRRRSRSRSRDRRRRRSRSRSDSRDRRSRRRRRSRSRSRDRDRKRRSRSGSGSDGERGSGKREKKPEAGGAAEEAEPQPEKPLEPGVVDVAREATIRGPIPTIADLIKKDPSLGVVKALARVEEEKHARAMNEQGKAQAQALMQANLNGAQQATEMGASVANPSPALTKPARELFVGNLPSGTQAPQLSAFVAAAMAQLSLVKGGPGSPVINTWLSPDGRFAFVEFRSVEEATAALALNNLATGGGAAQLRVGRPKEYQPSYLAVKDTPLNTLSVSAGVPGMAGVALTATGAANVAGPVVLPGAALSGAAATAVGAAVAAVMGSPYLMLMNLPTLLGELDVKELLKPFGALKSFNLLKDKEGQSKGIAIFEFAERAEMQVALKGLAGLEIGGKRLAIQEIPTAQANMLLRPVAPTAIGDEGAGASTVVRLSNMLTAEMEAEELGEIKDEVADECRKYGNLVEVVCGTPEAGLLIFVQFGDARASQRALRKLHGRSFDGRSVAAEYYPLEAFKEGDYGADPLPDGDGQQPEEKEQEQPEPNGEEAADDAEEEEAAAAADAEPEAPAAAPPGPVVDEDLD